jgi:hypothetical protein
MELFFVHHRHRKRRAQFLGITFHLALIKVPLRPAGQNILYEMYNQSALEAIRLSFKILPDGSLALPYPSLKYPLVAVDRACMRAFVG